MSNPAEITDINLWESKPLRTASGLAQSGPWVRSQKAASHAPLSSVVAEHKLQGAMSTAGAGVPSSHGSLDEEAPAGTGANPVVGQGPEDPASDGFDSDEFRQWLRERAQRRGRVRGDGARDRRRRRDDRESDDEDDGAAHTGKGGGTQPPEWDGIQPSFQDGEVVDRYDQSSPKDPRPTDTATTVRSGLPGLETPCQGCCLAPR